jgi:hypothetical protein
MGWENRYLLPWDGLDHERIRDAAEHVLRSGGGLDLLTRYEIETHSPNGVSVFFHFPAALERRRNPPDAARTFALYGIADTEDGNVEIVFEYDPPGNKYGLRVQASFVFDSNRSGNPLFSDTGIEIAERIGRFFGVACEPL